MELLFISFMARKLAIRKSSEGIGQLHRPCTSLCPAAKLRLLPSSGQMENKNAPPLVVLPRAEQRLL